MKQWFVLFIIMSAANEAAAEEEQQAKEEKTCMGECGGGVELEIRGSVLAPHRGAEMYGYVYQNFGRDGSGGVGGFGRLVVGGTQGEPLTAFLQSGLRGQSGPGFFLPSELFVFDVGPAAVFGTSATDAHSILIGWGAGLTHVYRGFETVAWLVFGFPWGDPAKDVENSTTFLLTSLYTTEHAGIGFMFSPDGLGPRLDLRFPVIGVQLRLFLAAPLYHVEEHAFDMRLVGGVGIAYDAEEKQK